MMSGAKKGFDGFLCKLLECGREDAQRVHQHAKHGLFGSIAQGALAPLFSQLLRVKAPLQCGRKVAQGIDFPGGRRRAAMHVAGRHSRIYQLGRGRPVFLRRLLATQQAKVCSREL